MPTSKAAWLSLLYKILIAVLGVFLNYNQIQNTRSHEKLVEKVTSLLDSNSEFEIYLGDDE
jgi:hypothetical protein